ncbi:MAG: hypothetical protein IKX75_06825 [Desulfovibrio sp.]|nr:hypothetical protein [Desulfovibrio sp.]
MKAQRRLAFLLLVAIAMAALALGCSRRPTSTAEVPRVVSPAYSIAVMPFTQPTDACQLIMGRIPENQGCIDNGTLALLDADLRDLLLRKQNGRVFAFEGPGVLPKVDALTYRSSSQPQALPRWIALGKKTGKDLMLVPMVMDWHERQGSEAGVDKPAHVRVEMYLVRCATGSVVSRGAWEEEQTGLADNLLNVGTFVKRKGQWVTARRLAQEGMESILKEMGL